MQIRKVIKRRIRHRSGGVDLAGDVNAVISANVGGVSKRTEGGATRSKTEKKTDAELPEEEVERQRGEPLPDREVMSIVYPQPIPPDAELDNLMPNDPIPKDIPKDSI